MKDKIWFDMDGVLADLYNVPDWLPRLRRWDASPYQEAAPMLRLAQLAYWLNRAKSCGYNIGIISWTSKDPNEDFHKKVIEAKKRWLYNHLPSVNWDTIHIVRYGTNKWETCGEGILFDDEERNRNEWQGTSYEPSEIIKVLKELVSGT